MKYKLFIGSSSEHVEYAESVQLNIGKLNGIQAVCWHQGIFNVGRYPLEDLLTELEKMSFGIFILAPDDFIKIRGEKYSIVRDNVLFEMGMFFGALGRERTFFIAPEGTEEQFRIPSDLEGINPARYIWASSDDDIEQRIGPACTEIKRILKKEMQRHSTKNIIKKYGVFSEFDSLYNNLFQTSTLLTTSFIHSRRWRESNLGLIDQFLRKKESHWDMILPDIENEHLITTIKGHFSDGQTMVSKIIDAYTYAIDNAEKYANKLTIYLYSFYPTYSFYKFDNEMIVSLYPLTSERKPTPTVLLDLDSEYSCFFANEIKDITKMSRIISIEGLKELVRRYTC